MSIKVLLPPGMGDIHWVMLKMRALQHAHARDIDLYVWDPDGKQRVDGYMQAVSIPGVNWAGYRTIPLQGEAREVWQSLYETGEACMHINRLDFDYVIGFNAMLERGTSVYKILPEWECDWSYPLVEEPADAHAVRDKFGLGAGQYIIYQWHGIGSYKQSWYPHFGPVEMARLMGETYAATGLHAVMIGLEWDVALAKELLELCSAPKPWLMDLTTKTTTGELFALQRRAAMHVGFASGSGIMATHLRTPTIMLWAERWPSRDFSTCWAPPGSNLWYKPLFVEDKPGVLCAIQEML